MVDWLVVRVGEITGSKVAKYRQNTGKKPYVKFHVEMYQEGDVMLRHVYTAGWRKVDHRTRITSNIHHALPLLLATALHSREDIDSIFDTDIDTIFVFDINTILDIHYYNIRY